MLSKKYKTQMITLMELGYTNFNENETLVKRFDGNIEQIVNHILGM